MTPDYYKVLGVSEDASSDEIKKSYRKLAKKYHPDRHKGDKAAEAKFKEISEANTVLSDSQKKQEYDTIRKYGGFAPGGGGGFSGMGGGPSGMGGGDFSHFERGPDGSFHFSGNIEDIFGDLFGGGGARGGGGQSGDPFASIFGGAGRGQSARQSAPPAGANLLATIEITFLESIHGVKKMLLLSNGKKIRVTIPPKIEDNKTIRLAGQGEPSRYEGGKNGNLIITVRVMKDKQFTRKGNDIHTYVEVSFAEAALGCKKNVRTLSKSVALSIPPGTQPGAKMRLKGIGLETGGKKGDLYVEVRVTIPENLTDKQKKLLEEWGE